MAECKPLLKEIQGSKGAIGPQFSASELDTEDLSSELYAEDLSSELYAEDLSSELDTEDLSLGSDPTDLVSMKRGERRTLPRPVRAILTRGSLEDTEYKDNPAEVNGWGKFYLPTITKMEVIGYVEGTSYPCDQLVLMTCEEKKVYGFDGEELHLVAFSLDQMFTKGIADPALQSYYRGEAFKDVTKEDWEEVKQGPVGKRLEEEHRQLVSSLKSAFLENLKIIRQQSWKVPAN